jgi:hypothetical protein
MNRRLDQSPPYKTIIWFMIGVPFMFIASIKIKSNPGEWLASAGTLIWMYASYCLGKYDVLGRVSE